MSTSNKSCIFLVVLGLVATASLLLVPTELLIPGGPSLPAPALRALATAQPLLLVLIGVAIGCALARKVRLEAPAIAAMVGTGRTVEVLARQVPPALLVGAGTSLILLAYEHLSEPFMMQPGYMAPDGAELLPLATRLLYGGIGEELMLRWGAMTLLVWVGWRLAGRPATPPPSVYWLGVVGAAGLFAVAHLPLLFALSGQTQLELLVLVLVGNAVPGIGFGWLFWRYGLEAAMLAHGLAHAFAALAGVLAP